MDKDRIYELIQKYEAQTATVAEREELLNWYREAGYQDAEYPDSASMVSKRMWQRLRDARERKPRGRKLYGGWWAAAMLCVAASIYFYKSRVAPPLPKEATIADIAPGGKKAVLTLANGQHITLSKTKEAVVIQPDQSVRYNDGTPVWGARAEASEHAQGMNQISTPTGGMYQVILPDGTKVWLNAGSHLRYPADFASARWVELEGEAYFSVAKRPESARPFLVKSGGQEVDVLGTEFNISAYEHEKSIKTTLINGRIKVSDRSSATTFVLSPHEQTILTAKGLRKETTDVEAAVAWKNGKFSFDGKSFTQVMDELSRWYNLEVVYEGPVPSDTFIGDAYRTDNLSLVLEFLKSSNIRYRIEQGENGDPHQLVIINK